MILSEKSWTFKKGQKMDIFQRGYSMDFVQNSKFLVWVFFKEIMSQKIVFRYSG